jgi:phasin
MTTMAETKTVKAAKAAPALPAFEAGKFEFPKFEMPKFEMPKFDAMKFDGMGIEMPAAFRDMAEKSLAQAKTNYEKIKTATEDATDVLEETYSTASKGAAEFGLKAIEAARTNSNAAFDFAKDFLTVKSLSEAVELSTAHMRKQFDAYVAQSKDLTALAQKVATDTAEPMKASVTKVMKTAA